MATAVLHNLSVMWNDPFPGADHPDADLPEVPPEFQDGNRRNLPENRALPRNRAVVRVEGEVVRDRLRQYMPEATAEERRKMARNSR